MRMSVSSGIFKKHIKNKKYFIYVSNRFFLFFSEVINYIIMIFDPNGFNSISLIIKLQSLLPEEPNFYNKCIIKT